MPDRKHKVADDCVSDDQAAFNLPPDSWYDVELVAWALEMARVTRASMKPMPRQAMPIREAGRKYRRIRVVELIHHRAARLEAEVERLRAALDKIAGICLGDRDSNLPAAKIHKIAVDALRSTNN